MCKFLSKSGGVPFQISFFLGDLTRNDPEGREEAMVLGVTGVVTKPVRGMEMRWEREGRGKGEGREEAMVLGVTGVVTKPVRGMDMRWEREGRGKGRSDGARCHWSCNKACERYGDEVGEGWEREGKKRWC